MMNQPFFAYDRRTQKWIDKSEKAKPYKKGEGYSVMVDDSLQRYALGVDERRETMLSVKDARGESEEYHGRTEEHASN